MDNKKFRELQFTMLSVMKDIHEICVRNNLRYYLIGGSALGAVRHKGFIPWDVDIDIAMPREDYELFVKKYSSELKPCHECVSYLNRDTFSPPHALVLLKNSEIIDITGQRQTNLRPSEIFVDILPLDICPESEELQEKQAKILKRIKTMKYYKASWIFPFDNLLRRTIKRCVRCLFLPFSWKYLNTWQQNEMQKYNATSKSGIWCSMASHYTYKKLSMPQEVFGTPTLHEFEDTELFVEEHVEEYLSRLFGDYMRLPKSEDQMSLRNKFVDATW